MVVRVSREDLRLLGGDGGVTFDEGGHDTTSSLNTEGKRGNIEKEQILGLLGGVTRKDSGLDSGLDSGTVNDSLIVVDGPAGLLAVEGVEDKLDDTGNTSGTINKDFLVNVAFVDPGVVEDLFDGFESGTEEVSTEISRERHDGGRRRSDTFYLDDGLGGRGKDTPGTVASNT